MERKMLIDIFKISRNVEKFLNKKIKIIKIKNNHKIQKKLIKIVK